MRWGCRAILASTGTKLGQGQDARCVSVSWAKLRGTLLYAMGTPTIRCSDGVESTNQKSLKDD